MSNQGEYHDNLVRMLELVWGEGYMAPGGAGNVSKMLDGLDTAGKRILDVGCGIGGPAVEMARSHGAEVVGIDLEAPLVDRALQRAADLGMTDRCTFRTVTGGALEFDDMSFDIVTSAGAVTQTADETSLFAEIFRVLRPGGHVRCYEWLRTDRPYSDDMRYWFELEGLTYAMKTLDTYREVLADAGFDHVATEDATAWYRSECRREYARIRGELYPIMIDVLGKQDADHFVENWRAMLVVIENGEMRQGYLRGRRPA